MPLKPTSSLRFLASLASGESQIFDFLAPDRWPVFSGAALSRMHGREFCLHSICEAVNGRMGLIDNGEDDNIFC